MAQWVEKHHVAWYRSTLFAALLVAMTAFCEPGMFSALDGMGAGGGASPDITNAANAIVFGVLAVASLFTSGIVNRITPKWGLVAKLCRSIIRTRSRHWIGHRKGTVWAPSLFTLWGFCDPMVSVFNYWLCGCLSNDLNETAMITALIDSISCLGSTFAFVVSALHVDYNWACGINLLLFGISLPGVAWVVFTQVTKTTQNAFAKGADLAVYEFEDAASHAVAVSSAAEKNGRFVVKGIDN